jgi:hypothetical protein
MMGLKLLSGSRSFFLTTTLIFLTTVPALSQQAATITYTQDFPGSDPSHYMISISFDGHAHYEGNGRLITASKYSTDDSVPDNEQLDFTASSSTITKVFDLAKRANYFQGDVENKKRNLAFTGKKTLTYTDGSKKNSVTYNYASVPEVQELTRVFQNLSSTLEYGRRLEYCHRHQKLALDQESKQMESTAKGGGLEDVAAVGPILQRIIDDRSVINVVRARLQRLLESK